MGELREAIEEKDVQHQEEELGDILFSVVNVARFLKIDSEHALSKACDKFVQRFNKVEQMANQKGLDMKDASLEELDALWEKAKTNS